MKAKTQIKIRSNHSILFHHQNFNQYLITKTKQNEQTKTKTGVQKELGKLFKPVK